MILNNASDSQANWKVSNADGSEQGTKGPLSWGTIAPPPGPYNYSTQWSGPAGTASADNIDNPDAMITYLGDRIIVTYPGA